MNKLHTYGCSFTQGMWEYDYRGDGMTDHRYDGKGASKPYKEGIEKDWNWPSILSRTLGLEIRNYGLEGSGPLEVIQNVLDSCSRWDEGDMIIIQLPLFCRQYNLIDKTRGGQNTNRDIEKKVWEYIEGVFNLLEKTNYRWFWFQTEPCQIEEIENGSFFEHRKLNFPNFTNYKDWMIKNDVRYFYDSDLLGKNCIDYHQNKLGHVAHANIFKKQLK